MLVLETEILMSSAILRLEFQKEKIYIINSRGEVAVNHHDDTRLYSTLHAFVNGMFPSMSSSDQAWTFIIHIFFPDRYCKLLEENLLRERTANFFFVFLFGAKILTEIVLVGGRYIVGVTMLCCIVD